MFHRRPFYLFEKNLSCRNVGSNAFCLNSSFQDFLLAWLLFCLLFFVGLFWSASLFLFQSGCVSSCLFFCLFVFLFYAYFCLFVFLCLFLSKSVYFGGFLYLICRFMFKSFCFLFFSISVCILSISVCFSSVSIYFVCSCFCLFAFLSYLSWFDDQV